MKHISRIVEKEVIISVNLNFTTYNLEKYF